MIITEHAKRNLLILSWALYDLANQFFALNVVSLYFPRWLTIENNTPEIFYGLSFGISMLLVAVCAPFLGTMADIKGRHKPFLIFFTLIAVIFTVALGLTKSISLALIFFAIANFGCQEAIIFYNALMIKVAPGKRIGLVSGLGRMFGYSGAILALLFTKPIIMKVGYQMTFIVTGVLFFLFALPCMLFVRDSSCSKKSWREDLFDKSVITETISRLKESVFKRRMFEGLIDFLKVVFFLLCVVNTVILFMSIYASRVFGLTTSQVIDLIAFSTVFAMVSSVVSGYISDLVGYRKALMGVFVLWILCILGGGLLNVPFHWLLGAIAGTSLGATWVILRAMIIKLIPEENLGEAFGIFNLIGYLSAVIGPVLWGLTLLYFTRMGEAGYRIAFLSMILFLIVGMLLLVRKGKDILKGGK
ncbi:MAG: MFS transporter [Candidatus Omnitrophica bacterium]|nr:MFS transporter [Candidatus Omnitrophota bacterium]